MPKKYLKQTKGPRKRKISVEAYISTIRKSVVLRIDRLFRALILLVASRNKILINNSLIF